MLIDNFVWNGKLEWKLFDVKYMWALGIAYVSSSPFGRYFSILELKGANIYFCKHF